MILGLPGCFTKYECVEIFNYSVFMVTKKATLNYSNRSLTLKLCYFTTEKPETSQM